MTKDRAFYRNFFSIFTALVLQNVITLSVNLADNIMLGAYSETALSGAAVGTLTARIVECTVLITYIVKKEKNLQLTIRGYVQRDPVLSMDYFKVCLPMVAV